MSNEHRLLKDLETGQQANIALDLVGDRLDLMRTNLHEKWESTKWDQREEREECWRQLKAISELKRSFMNDIKGAKLAQVELEKDNG